MSARMMEKLDPKTFPLFGNRLIEASAGTGKTYTIANLYLRLILGHERQQPLTVDQVLVVTFTDAATAELKDRIRKKLQEARKAFADGRSEDPFIAFLISSLDRHRERAELLLAAERQMDEAAVFTIHGFSQRMLKQHAFESGTLFSSELITDESKILSHTVADFWRKHFYSLDKPVAQVARRLWKTPDSLLRDILSVLGKSNLNVILGSVPESLDEFDNQYIKPAIAIRELWKREQQDIEEQVKAAGFRKNAKPLNRLKQMAAFAHSADLYPTLGNKESWGIYSRQSLDSGLLKSGTRPEHPVFEQINELASLPLNTEDAFKSMVIARALEDIRTRRRRYKAEKHQMSFDDLLCNLQSALQGSSGEALAEAIRNQFPIAMIDEFQDTDPLQYDIFSKIYPVTHTDCLDTGLFMIGDPKQAIYAFRGADIFTYMKAKEQVKAHYSLDTNWRSTCNMVNSVNRIFSRSHNPFIYEQIPFDSVFPSPKADNHKLIQNSQPLSALNLWLQDNGDQSVSTGDYQGTMTQATVTEIHRLLTSAAEGTCLITTADEHKSLKAGDIAVLVRTGRQAELIRQALAEKNIASVYMSSRDSVFDSMEACDLLRLLSACLNPSNDRILRAALATSILNLTAAELDALNEDEVAWESAVEEFSDYHQLWLRQGILPMIRVMIRQRSIAQQLFSRQHGERRLTDLLHLGELLASASTELESPHALLRWFSDQIQSPDVNADDQQLHLESERNLVQIVTIHKSKGLEYPVVFLPFACSHRESDDPVFHDNGRTSLDLSGNPEALEKADKERLAEDLRLLYVALTRSVYACYVGLAPVKKGRSSAKTDLHKTSIGWLLAEGRKIACTDLPVQVQQLAEDHDFISVTQPPAADSLPAYQPPVEPPRSLSAREFTGSIEKNWWVTSYSALSRTAHSANITRSIETTPDASSETAGLDLEAVNPTPETSAKVESIEETMSIFSFPKGARPGTFMHTLFEEYPSVEEHHDGVSGFVHEQLLKEGFDEKWEQTLVEMLDHCLNTPLDGQNLTLGALPSESQKAEMEFYIPVTKLRSTELNALLASEDPLSKQAGQLDFATVKGMLKGFIDLTFEYQGRWYVLDYKSNWLGDQLDDYSRENMERVMIEHRYDLQYQIYSLALHRLLKTRLPDYRYDQHFGGVFYLFLRGVRKTSASQHGIFQHKPSETLLNKLDNLFAGGQVC